jgi:hypothetical protein
MEGQSRRYFFLEHEYRSGFRRRIPSSTRPSDTFEDRTPEWRNRSVASIQQPVRAKLAVKVDAGGSTKSERNLPSPVSRAEDGKDLQGGYWNPRLRRSVLEELCG